MSSTTVETEGKVTGGKTDTAKLTDTNSLKTDIINDVKKGKVTGKIDGQFKVVEGKLTGV